MTDLNKIWDYLVENNFTTEEALTLITKINGFNEKTFNDVIYVVSGYNTLEQLLEEEL